MGFGDMKIQIEPHTLQRAEERGTNIEEIRIVLEQGTEIPARETERRKQRFLLSRRKDLADFMRKSVLK